MPAADLLLIGVDGGATEVKAHAVARDSVDQPAAFQLRPEAAARVYPRLPDFAPVPVSEQLAQRDAGQPRLSAAENEQGRLWVQCAADAIADVARQAAARRVLIGMGMPGLKTPDQRGISIINNGPRNPLFLSKLEKLLAEAGLTLVGPIAALGSDADYCGLGEEHAADGLFRGVANAYYVGCGTGIADALKLRGQLVPFDAAKKWLLKSWQLSSALGPTFERLVSASALNRVYWDLAGTAGSAADSREFPEQAALRGDARAAAWLHATALILAEIIFERIATVRHGRSSAPHRGAPYSGLDTDHPYRGVLFERIIVGQRLGQIFAAPVLRAVFAQPLEECVAAYVRASDDRELRARCLAPDGMCLASGFLQPSRLRAAPAIGAAVAAVRANSQP